MKKVKINRVSRKIYKEITNEKAPKDAAFDACTLAFLLAVKAIKAERIKS